MSHKILVSALEPSANLHLREVAQELENISYEGIFDRALGVPMYDPSEFGVMGLIDILGVYFKAKRAIKEMVERSKKVDVVFLIDSPAFNIPLAKAIKKRFPDKKIIYYILPKVWAWKAGRAKKVLAYTDMQLSIFPFEDKFYPTATYVGNPLMDEIKKYKEHLTDNDTIAYLAGSRKNEVRRLMPYLREIRQRLSDKKALLVIPEHFSDEQIAMLYGDISDFEISRATHEAVYDASFAFVFSGTATLETALIGTPLILLLRVHDYEFKIMRKIVKLPYIGLANILFDFAGKKEMHPEFLQNDMVIDTIIESYQNLDRERFLEESKELRRMLGKNANKKVAQILMDAL